jgi:hypothetical protein
MAVFEFLPVSSEEIPIEIDFTIGSSTYSYLFRYNETYDFYTVEIRNENDELIYTTKLTYASDLINAVVEGLTISQIVVPINLLELTQNIALQNQKVNKESFGKTVLLLLGKERE